MCDACSTIDRVPARFVPPDALGVRDAATGMVPAARIPAGSYVLAGQLLDPAHAGRHDPPAGLDRGEEPVQIAVTGAEALATGGRSPEGMLVDVIVTSEPGPGGGAGRTYVAASGVRLLGLAESGGDVSGGAGPVSSGAWRATLGLTRPQALRLIQAESFARQIRLIQAR